VNIDALCARAKFARDALTLGRSRGLSGPEMGALMLADSVAHIAYALAVQKHLTRARCADTVGALING
jgi:hypothetical protein